MSDAQQTSPEVTARVRQAIKDRAMWLALLYRTFSEVLPAEEVERQCRKAIYEFGRRKAAHDPPDFDPRAWVEGHVARGSAEVFASQIQVEEDAALQQMTFCPLVEAWRELGCSDEEIARLCDIAMEGDRGRAEAHGLRIELAQRIGQGDTCCKLFIRAR